MNAEAIIKINPKSVIEMHLTNRKRVAWLRRFGAQKNEFIRLTVAAPIELWAEAGERVRGDGTLPPLSTTMIHAHPWTIKYTLEKTARKYLLRHGWFGEEDDRKELDQLFLETIEKFVRKRAAAEERRDAERLEQEQTERARLERVRARREEQERTQEAWILEHGSERLKKALEIGLIEKCQRLYRDEYLKVEFEESDLVSYRYWRWEKGEQEEEIRNPSLEALEALETAKSDPRIEEPQLVYLRWCEDEEGYERRNVAAVSGRILGSRAYLDVGEIKKTWLGHEEWRGLGK